MCSYIVDMNEIHKSFGDVKAVVGGSFQLVGGEIHSLIGENGAGKSTMMKLLYGMYKVDHGEIKVRGDPVSNLDPKKAIEMGIGFVHQEFMLVNELSVLENIILGFEPRRGITIDFAKAREKISNYINNYHMDVQLGKRINQISVGEAQRVEIIKSLYRGANILILDEPTAVLTPQEAARLFEILKSLKEQGSSIIFISHKLDEVMAISDRITVMRQGEYVDTVQKSETNKAELARMMVGREVFLDVERKKQETVNTVLKVEDVWVSGEKELSKIRGVSLEVKAGEIVGIAGIDGNGQSELIEAIAGLRKVEKGRVFLDNADITNFSPRKIRQAGLAHIPDDRNRRGLNRAMDIVENIIAVKLQRRPFSQYGILKKEPARGLTQGLIEKFDIRPASPYSPLSALSGGNAQKVVVAREVDAGGKLLIAAQPSRGVDIGAIEFIQGVLNEEKAKGKGILLVSADLEEIFHLSDRIVVMYEGRITGSMPAEEATQEKVGLLMMGGNKGAVS